MIHNANENVYPCYSIIGSETLAEIKLQGSLGQTTSWIYKYLGKVLQVIDFKGTP